ncbi:hypothetical protein BGZ54_008385 [Gamsiella multidivaricata]|nr:hypothetical protein BGZ54_008385 [Gamsiella multidivaricata]
MSSLRGLMTQSNRQAPVLKYSGESNDHVSPQEYKIRVGKAVRTLREELPQFFQYGLCTTSIYASNIRLIEASHTNATIQGKPIYFLLAGAVRWSFKIWFRDLEFEIQSIRVNDRGGRGLKGMDSGGDYANATASILKYHSSAGTQPSSATRPGTFDHCMVESPLDFTYRHYPERGSRAFEMDCVDKLDRTVGPAGTEGASEEGQSSPLTTTVTIRWTMKGTTRPSVVLTSSGPAPPPPSSYAGVFVYQFNENGLVDEHRIENIMPSPSPEAIQRAFAWWGWLLSRTRPAAAAASDEAEARKRLGLGYLANK